MKLFYKPGACSLASHLILHEIGRSFEIELVDTVSGQTANGNDYRKINPKGYVPALQLDDGQVLTEGPAILQYLADGATTAELAPKIGTFARARMLEQLTFVSSELHKAFGPLFRDDSTEPEKSAAREAVAKKFDHVEASLADGEKHQMEESFTIADAYLFVVANWANFTGIDLARWPRLSAFVSRVFDRPAAQAAMRAEGLIQ
ncbi:glutathione S-transferase [Citromicrobium sp. JL31]|uniref:glutathione transferase GstA n=1 Tax=Alphaproteobacteria TaxID=28211 RepID=UPI0006C8E78B|nr:MULTISPECIES: glutathione transferase GstA [Alphaproteobacteria]KPM16584.1 glutathione S-transferase [Citromicrobium sp. JL31]KPM18612.1 glutathione S-transferase [Citromicrobium sp. JL1351]KPM29602.1 glutathione S-transferase [Citromicrobium sp. JL2201]MBA4802918.1 glutathione transferase GstA [Euryhalocaulis sp.]